MLKRLSSGTLETSRPSPKPGQGFPYREMFSSLPRRKGKQLELPTSGTAAGRMLCFLWHFWPTVIKALPAACFQMTPLQPQPKSLFPQVEKNERLYFIRRSSEIPISPHPGGEKQAEILTAASNLPFLSPLNALSMTGFDFSALCRCRQPAGGCGVLPRSVDSPALCHGHRLCATVSMARWDKQYQSHTEKMLFEVVTDKLSLHCLKIAQRL